MKHVQPDALLEQAIDIRAARTLCRDGWSCEQINSVLRNAEITRQQFETIQEQSRDLDRLRQDFGPPSDWLSSGHTETNHSEIDFLNHGPDAATEILREHGWQSYEISLGHLVDLVDGIGQNGFLVCRRIKWSVSWPDKS